MENKEENEKINEKENKNKCKIKIYNKIVAFTYYIKFNNKGKYKI